MLEGKRPDECTYCWAVEDLPDDHLSDRFFRSSEPWAAERFQEVTTAAWDQDIKPAYLEVNFNQACQLKCSYCSPALSSSWEQEIRKFGVFPTREGHVPIDYLEKMGLMPLPLEKPNPYVEAFWEWWPTIYSSLKVFRMTGGEPLLDENTFKILTYIKNNPNPSLSVSITSNMCPPDTRFRRFLDLVKELHENKCIKEVLLFVSVDSVGPQAEYIRHGLNFEKLHKNICTFLDEVPHASISVINTFNALSVVGFPKFLDMIQNLRQKYSGDFERIHFDTPRLYSPPFISCKILTDDYLDLLTSSLQEMNLRGFKQTEIEKMSRLIDWARTPDNVETLTGHRIDFYLFFHEHDRRRKTDFLRTFPEMKNFWHLTEKLAADHQLNISKGSHGQ